MATDEQKPSEASGEPGARTVKTIRIGLGLVMLGLVVQMIAALYWTPGSFILAAAIGMPAVGLGVVLFGWAAWKAIEVEGES